MNDQASQLRQLVMRANRKAVAEHAAPPRLVVVAGGKRGVGATTLAVNLSIALASQGCRTVLIDADLTRADAAAHCGCNDTPGIGDVLAGRLDIHEVLQLGPGGIQLAAGAQSSDSRVHCTEKSLTRLLKQIRSLGLHADTVVVDAGHAPEDIAARFWQSGDDVLLVTSPDAVAVMDSYATIKTMLSRAEGSISLRLLVNFADTAEIAADVHRRIDQSCQRFLGMSLELGGALPADDLAPVATQKAVPRLLSAPQSALAQAVERLAANLVQPNRGVKLPRRLSA